VTTSPPALVDARRLGKRFGPVVALKDADFALRAGRVSAIVGENGAGKSTLAKILAGVYRADEGAIAIDGKLVTISGRRHAAALGIGFVPQSLSFVGTLSAIDNHLLAGSTFALDRGAARRDLDKAAARIGIDAVLDRPVETLSLAERQLAEIVSSVAHGARALLLDEPTSALGPIEVDRLIAALKLLSAGETAIGLVTHRVREVLEGAHDVTVLRQGEVVFSGEAASLDAEAVSRLMVGARERGRPIRPTPGVETRLTVACSPGFRSRSDAARSSASQASQDRPSQRSPRRLQHCEPTCAAVSRSTART
jgi:simple sugar transport system ATP-binding protein